MTVERVAWTEAMSVGVDALDEDHRHLIDIINEVIEACEQADSLPTIASILDKLVRYAQEHLESEEALFKASDYPLVALHIKEHDAFLYRLSVTQHEIVNGRIEGLTGQTLAYLRNWLIGHIMRSDLGYAAYLAGRG